MEKYPWMVLGVMVGALGAALVFFSINPNRVGEITISSPQGPSMTVKVADSNDISKLIESGLANERSAGPLTASLLDIIERLPSISTLREKLWALVERRQPPFSISSIPVKLLYDSSLPEGLAAVCENSPFLAKNMLVYAVTKTEDVVLGPIGVHADGSRAYPCPSGSQSVRINSMKVEEFNKYTVMAKRNF